MTFESHRVISLQSCNSTRDSSSFNSSTALNLPRERIELYFWSSVYPTLGFPRAEHQCSPVDLEFTSHLLNPTKNFVYDIDPPPIVHLSRKLRHTMYPTTCFLLSKILLVEFAVIIVQGP